jgi:hypothetical protein
MLSTYKRLLKLCNFNCYIEEWDGKDSIVADDRPWFEKVHDWWEDRKEERENERFHDDHERDKKELKRNFIINDLSSFYRFIFDWHEWGIFVKRQVAVIVLFLTILLVWLLLLSPIVAPFYSSTKSGLPDNITKYESVPGKTTVVALRDSIDDLNERGFVLSFPGIRNWIDNRQADEEGQITMAREIIFGIENNLATNKGTSGKSKSIEKARSELFQNFSYPKFTSLDKTRTMIFDYDDSLTHTVEYINDYLIQLEKDIKLPMNKRKALFIVNSDNLSKVLNLIEARLYDSVKKSEGAVFFDADNHFYRMKGSLKLLERFLQGIEYDFLTKLKDKSCYDENFLPLLESIKDAKNMKSGMIISEFIFKDVSSLGNRVREIAKLVSDLSDKLNDG